jgi:hypothetical protein
LGSIADGQAIGKARLALLVAGYLVQRLSVQRKIEHWVLLHVSFSFPFGCVVSTLGGSCGQKGCWGEGNEKLPVVVVV